MPELPIDLVDCVIDQLYDDKKSLAALSLVSRTYLRTSVRRRLFHSISFRMLPKYRRAPDIDRFHEFFGHSTEIASMVKELRIVGDDLGGRAFCVHRILAPLLTNFPNLETLAIGKLYVTCDCNSLSLPVVPRGFRLRKLVLWTKYKTVAHCLGLLALFDRIDTVEILPKSWVTMVDDENAFSLSQVPPQPEIRSLAVRYPLDCELFRIIRHSSHSNALHSIRVAFIKHDTVEQFLQLIRCCPGIKALDFEVEIFIIPSYHSEYMLS